MAQRVFARKAVTVLCIVTSCLVGMISSCADMGSVVPVPAVSSDQELFSRVTVSDPFSSYTLFPRVDSVTSGTLNGSTAHQPLVRVSMNAKALSSLMNGSLPAGSGFPDGSVIFKQVIVNGQTVVYAVILKDGANPLSGNGWLWAEYHPDGTVAFSVTNKGSGCIGCHSLEQGMQHDHVRTFERQR